MQLLLIAALAAIAVAQSNNTNSTGAFCCQIYVDFVRLNVWYNTSLTYVRETVITQYAQYDNTIVPTATITIPNNQSNTISYGTRVDVGGSQYTFSGIPNVIGSDGVGYDGTAVNAGTVYRDNVTAM